MFVPTVTYKNKTAYISKRFKMSASPIFPEGCPPSIFSTFELNYRVRDGNGWTLKVIGTDCKQYTNTRSTQCQHYSLNLL